MFQFDGGGGGYIRYDTMGKILRIARGFRGDNYYHTGWSVVHKLRRRPTLLMNRARIPPPAHRRWRGPPWRMDTNSRRYKGVQAGDLVWGDPVGVSSKFWAQKVHSLGYWLCAVRRGLRDPAFNRFGRARDLWRLLDNSRIVNWRTGQVAVSRNTEIDSDVISSHF